MENPQYGESVNREIPQYINKTKEQEHNKPNLIKTNPPTALNLNEQTGMDVVQKWLEQIKVLNCQFTDLEIEAIKDWARYKAIKSPIFTKQIEFTLKILQEHKANKFDIVYMIQISIASGYGKIMDPTKACIAKPVAKIVHHKYPAKNYITPQTYEDKQDLFVYIKNCYMCRLDPRSNEMLKDDAMLMLNSHMSIARSTGLKWDDYIYQHEVETGISLLEQPV